MVRAASSLAPFVRPFTANRERQSVTRGGLPSTLATLQTHACGFGIAALALRENLPRRPFVRPFTANRGRQSATRGGLPSTLATLQTLAAAGLLPRRGYERVPPRGGDRTTAGGL